VQIFGPPGPDFWASRVQFSDQFAVLILGPDSGPQIRTAETGFETNGPVLGTGIRSQNQDREIVKKWVRLVLKSWRRLLSVSSGDARGNGVEFWQ
jgi:hypothetical protein